MKDTKQKEAILAAVCTTRTHPTADEIYDKVRANFPRISLGTVYRNLNIFSAKGDIKKILVPGSRDRFDYRIDKHDHLICDQCGNIFDVNVEININLKDTGIVVNEYNLILYGICEKCSEKFK